MEQSFASGIGPDPTLQGSTDATDHGDSPVEPRALPGSDDDLPRIDVADPAFAVRLARLLVHRRESIGVGLGAMARRSNGSFTRAVLRDLEAGAIPLDAAIVSRLVALYGVDLDDITPARIRIRIDPAARTVSAGGVAAHFDETDPDELLRTYLRLVRRLRDQHDVETISLRRDDVEDLARFLGRPTEAVLHRLCDLMGSTRTQRRMVVGMCLAGAMVVTVAVPSAAAVRGTPLDEHRPDHSPTGRTMDDPLAIPFLDSFLNPLPGTAPGSSARSIGPVDLDPDLGSVIVVDIDGTWDRDAVLDAEGRLNWPEMPDEVIDDIIEDVREAIIDDLIHEPDGRSTGTFRAVSPDPPPVLSADTPAEGSFWIPPFPERIVDPGRSPGG